MQDEQPDANETAAVEAEDLAEEQRTPGEVRMEGDQNPGGSFDPPTMAESQGDGDDGGAFGLPTSENRLTDPAEAAMPDPVPSAGGSGYSPGGDTSDEDDYGNKPTREALEKELRMAEEQVSKLTRILQYDDEILHLFLGETRYA